MMDEKEKKVQKALGLLRKYSGYIKPKVRTSYYEVRAVRALSPEAAQAQLSKLTDGTLKFIVDETTGKIVWNNQQQS